MNKNDLVRSLIEREELSRKQAIAIIDGVFSDIQACVVSGEPMKIPGFGQFKIRDSKARMGRNPATGETIKIAAKKTFKFLAAKALKDAVLAKGGRKAASAKKASPAKKTAKKATSARKVSAKKPGRKATK